MMAWTPFYDPMTLRFHSQIWLLLPLCASVAIIYKTVRTRDLRRLPREVVAAFAYMVVGLAILAAALWGLQEYWP